MACLQKLREDILLLESIFPGNHDRFQVCAASVDEISVRFVAPGDCINISANIQVSGQLIYCPIEYNRFNIGNISAHGTRLVQRI
jgi:hypothetical protein